MPTFVNRLTTLWQAALHHLFASNSRDDHAVEVSADTASPEAVALSLPQRTIRASITLHAPKGNQATVVQTMVIDPSRPKPEITLIKVQVPWTRQTMSALVLDEFGRLYSYCREQQVVADIYVGYRRVREALWSVKASFPAVRLLEHVASSDEPTVFRLDLAHRPAVAPRTKASHAPASHAPTHRLAVATDGSAAGNWRNGIGWACVAGDGRHATGNSQSGNNATLAELNAIELALRTFSGPLDIHTDCRSAIAWINNPSSACNQQCYSCAKRVSRLISASQSNLIWVKGHAGHPLNETADRLARIARLELQGMYQGSAAEVADRVAHDQNYAPVLAA